MAQPEMTFTVEQMPIRLQIAAWCVAGMLGSSKGVPLPEQAAQLGLLYADELIKQHDKQ